MGERKILRGAPDLWNVKKEECLAIYPILHGLILYAVGGKAKTVPNAEGPSEMWANFEKMIDGYPSNASA